MFKLKVPVEMLFYTLCLCTVSEVCCYMSCSEPLCCVMFVFGRNERV